MTTKQLELTKEQRIAYDRFIRARDRVTNGKTWVRPSEFEGCLDVEALNHPLFVVNQPYMDYLEAFDAWLDIEPRFRQEERMRASRGDYGLADSWDDRVSRTQDTFSKIKGD
jgi:hypothetical protein